MDALARARVGGQPRTVTGETLTSAVMLIWRHMVCCAAGNHAPAIWCESQAVFLRCIYCGWRSPGWRVKEIQ